ncbi:E3 ubiquitin-protein ligase ZNF598-like [Asterias rubens]|uniref:E3 ubiquitin-protein ligase ZNF598-like n=1 Tax=Asterias rubens TaxID=7604 RepID=UPI00145586BE|nr:E3 ubiquitin-protein ligase ZNF598-like [Asterias rubens]
MSKTTDSISSTCVLCCSGIKFYAVGQCNHHICLKCSTRMRVLCEQKYCAVCRADMPKVIATLKLHPFHGIISHKYPVNRKAGIAFAMPEIQNEFRKLLWDICTICRFSSPEKSFKDLQDHMRKEHELFYCDLCIDQLKVFPFERKTYTRKDLAVHRRKGDGKDTSYRGHPLCEFCDERYFDNDELLRHLRQQHYFCHFCETDGVSNQYYNDYDDLKEHFRLQHYLCEDDRCSQEQFTHAFRSEIDLKAHRSTAHSNLMSKSQVRQMRQIDMQINFPPRPTQRDGGAPGFRGRGRRFHGNRDDDLSTALQASMDTKRQETAERSDGRRQGREERETKKTKLKKPSDPDDARGEAEDKMRKAETQHEIEGAVAMDTSKHETVSEQRRMRKNGGRISPRSEDELKMRNGATKTLSNNNNISETPSSRQNSGIGLPEKVDVVKETGKKKKKKKGKGPTNSNDNNSQVLENDLLQSKPDVRVNNPVELVASDFPETLNEAKGSDRDKVAMNAKSATSSWTTPSLNPTEDFPSLGKSSGGNIGGSSAGGFSFYNALQKTDTKPKLENPPPMPARRTFQNKEDDFPTLSSIAGILGVEPMPSKTNRTNKSNSQSAWSVPREKANPQPAASKQDTVKQKKKGKKATKENRQVVLEGSSQIQQQAVETQKKNKPPQETQSTMPKRPPPGLPPGLAPKESPSMTPSRSMSQPVIETQSQVSPPPGFAAGMSFSSSSLPPGLHVYVPPSDFKKRNLQLATKIKELLLGNQEDKFNMFRSISSMFRDGSMSAEDYFMECRELLGDNLPKIFNELVSLLPDVVKQQELMSAESDFRIQQQRQKDDGVLKIGKTGVKGRGRGSGAWKSQGSNETCSCPQCGQVIHRSQLDEHLNTRHQDFPTLNAGTRQPIHVNAAAPSWPRI